MANVTAHIRYKTDDGKIVPGITTVLGVLAKPALYRWNNQMGLKNIDTSKYVDSMAAIGTLGHAIVTDSLIGKEPDYSDYDAKQIPLAENCALSFFEWQKQHTIKTMFVEKPLVHQSLRFGGTNDIYAEVDGNLEIIDLKTGKGGVYPEHVYQVAALKKLLEHHGFPVDKCRVVNIPRSEDEGFVEKVCTPAELENGWEIFKNCLSIYYLKKA
jgi:hypothetical protein